MKTSHIALAALALGGFGIPHAQAAEYLITYTGTVTAASGDGSAFGVSSATDLDGMSYTAVFTLNYPDSGATTYGNASITETYGGPAWGNDSPLSAEITINNQEYYINAELYSDEYKEYGIDYTLLYDAVLQSYSNGIYFYSYYTDNAFNSTNLSENFTYTYTNADSAYGYVGGTDFDIGLVPSTVSVTTASISAVPEPTSWALLITGFGAIGFVLRRRPVATTLRWAT